MMQKLGAEFLGTFVFVFVGVAAAVLAAPSVLGIALAFGLAATAMIYAVGCKSGGHFNPAVTLAMAVNGRCCWGKVIPYIITQVLGGLAGAGLVYLIASGKGDVTSLAANGWGEGMGGFGKNTAMLTEIVLTAIFVFIVLGVSKNMNGKSVAPLIVGLALAMLILVGSKVTGGSLNPARSTGSAVIMGGKAYDQLWLFWVAPLLGALVGGYLFKWTCGCCNSESSCTTSAPKKDGCCH